MASLRVSPIDKWMTLWRSCNRLHSVPFPEPGAPAPLSASQGCILVEARLTNYVCEDHRMMQSRRGRGNDTRHDQIFRRLGGLMNFPFRWGHFRSIMLCRAIKPPFRFVQLQANRCTSYNLVERSPGFYAIVCFLMRDDKYLLPLQFQDGFFTHSRCIFSSPLPQCRHSVS